MLAGVGVTFVGPALSTAKIVEAGTKHILTRMEGMDTQIKL